MRLEVAHPTCKECGGFIDFRMSPEATRLKAGNAPQTSFLRDPSRQIIRTLGPKVCKYYLDWATWIPTGLQRPEVQSPGPWILKPFETLKS